MSGQVRRSADGELLSVRAGDGPAVGRRRWAQVPVEVGDRHQLHRYRCGNSVGGRGR